MRRPQPLAGGRCAGCGDGSKTGMRLVGVVENMSSEVFGSGGGDRLAAELGVPLLGRVPLERAARVRGRGHADRASGSGERPAVAIVQIAEAVDAQSSGRVHPHAPTRLVSFREAAAFFDLDRTLTSRSSALALAPAFRRRGLIDRTHLAKAALWQLVFAARGVGAAKVQDAAENGMRFLAGVPVADLQALVEEAMAPVLRPLVYAEPLRLVEQHRSRGETRVVVSATLYEIVALLAQDLGFDGAIGTTAEIATACTRAGRAAGPRRGEGSGGPRACGDAGPGLTSSFAYPTRLTDRPLLEAVGRPVAVNPDAGSAEPPGARLAGARVSRARRCHARARHATGGDRLSARPPRRHGTPCGLSEARPRGCAALGFAGRDAETLAAHFLWAERTGRGPRPRADRVAGAGPSRLAARPRPARVEEQEVRALGRRGALGYLTLAAASSPARRGPARRARLVVCSRTFPTGALGYWARLLADAGLVAVLTATSPRRLPVARRRRALTGTNPLAIAVPSSDGRPLAVDVSMGAVTHGDVLAGTARPEELVPFGGPQAYKAFALAVGLQVLVDALNPERRVRGGAARCAAGADPVPALRALAAGVRLPGDRDEL